MPKLFIHIGYPKTATKSLQWGLFRCLHEQGKINYAIGQRSQESDGGVLGYWSKLADGIAFDDRDIPLS